MDIPTREPDELVAGDTIAWRREDLADYPASGGWALTYELRNALGAISIAASADGAHHAVSVAASVSAGYVAGVYAIAGFVTKSGERRQVYLGTLTIKPNLARAGAVDARSHARKVLDAIEALIEGRASKDQQSYRIGDRELVRMTPDELLKLRNTYRAEVAREADAERLAQGRPTRRRILTRFPRVGA